MISVNSYILSCLGIMEYTRVKYKNKDYAIINVKYKTLDLPVLVDNEDIGTIINLDKSWKSNKYGFISCSHSCNNEIKEVFMHELVIALKMKDLNKKRLARPITHLNRIGLDNRRDNLIYDVQDINKEYSKSNKKKKRTVTLPPGCGIDPDEIPTYVWYTKPDKTHGDRFTIKIGDTCWKGTSSNKVTLKYKLEEAKAYLRQLKKDKPELFRKYSMNGDYTQIGGQLTDTYYSIVHKGGYTHIDRYIPENNTTKLLKVGSITRKERTILKGQLPNLMPTQKRRRVLNSLPPDCGVSPNDIPQYCYFKPAYNGRGSYFTVRGHPHQDAKVWQTTTSKKVSVEDKFKQLQGYLAGLV